MNFPSVTSINDEVCYLQNPIREKINYSSLSKTLAMAVHCASYIIKTQIKLLSNKTWNSMILEYFLKIKSMKEVVSEMGIITTSYTEEIIRHNMCQMIFLDNFLLKNVNKKLMISAITCSMLEYPSNSNHDDMNTGVSKSTLLGSTIKHVTKEKIICRRAARNLVSREHKIIFKISIMEIFTLKSMSGRSIYNTITRRLRKEILQ